MFEPKFKVYKGGEGFYYRLMSSGGVAILSGEGYKTREDCIRCVILARDFAHVDGLYKTFGGDKSWHFELLSPWGETVGKSHVYTTPRAVARGIEAVKHNAPRAGIEDLS
ncbi:MAG: YegP family protein [Chlorobi bacterium]|nr:YegP family protein [Chlorobiota bacterium]